VERQTTYIEICKLSHSYELILMKMLVTCAPCLLVLVPVVAIESGCLTGSSGRVWRGRAFAAAVQAAHLLGQHLEKKDMRYFV